MTIKIIALTGVAGSGKSTVANHLVAEHDFALIKFAEPLKWMLQSIGLGQAELEGNMKEDEMPLLSYRTPRFAMQTLGGDWGRDIMGKDFWVNIWKDRVKALVSQGFHHIITDDCRYPNEEEAIRDMGGCVWRVDRPHTQASLLSTVSASHGSETEMGLIEVSEVIKNEQDIHHLEFIVNSLMEENLN